MQKPNSEDEPGERPADRDGGPRPADSKLGAVGAEREAVSQLGADSSLGTALEIARVPNPGPADPTTRDDPSLAQAQVDSRILGQYQLLEELGRGGMGTVFRAVHRKLDRTVALKILPADRFRSQEMVSRFEREMRAIGRLQHPNIVAAHDAGEVDGCHFLVMELVDGEDVGHLASRKGRLPIAEACEIARQAALGLQAICDDGLVHRDIKPSNLMLARPRNRKSPPTVKILDLGLALLETSQSGAARELTSTGQIMGTVDYMAPEQALDTHRVDIRADLYSLGATLFRLLAGRAPLEEPRFNTAMKRLAALEHESPPAVTQLRTDCPADLASLVQRLLSKSPGDRPAQPQDVADALAPFAANANLQMLLEGETSAAARVHNASFSEPTVTTSPLAPTRVLPPRTTEVTPSPQQHRARGRRFLWMAAAPLIVLLGAGIYFATGDGKHQIEATADLRQKTEGPAERATSRTAEAVEPSAPGRFGLEFNGIDNYVEVPSLICDGVHPITLEGWVSASQFPPDDSAALLGWQGGINIGLGPGGFVTGLSFSPDGQVVRADPQKSRFIPLREFQHVAIVWDGDVLRSFVSGKAEPVVPLPEMRRVAGIPGLRANNFAIGCEIPISLDPTWTKSRFLCGRVREVRISRIARYHRSFVPRERFESDDDTLALYHFDEGSGDQLTDSSGHGRHGKIVGAKWVRPDQPFAPLRAVAPFDAAQARRHQEDWASSLGVPVQYTNSIGMKFVLIPPGQFLMGSLPEEIELALKHGGDDKDRNECIKSEAPRHRVLLTKPFYLSVYEVTQGQHQAVTGKTPSSFAKSGTMPAVAEAVAGIDTARFPVEMVAWNDAEEFCTRLSEKESLLVFDHRAGAAISQGTSTGYRLPTEAEWEFACRAGTTTKFWNGEQNEDQIPIGWFHQNSGDRTHQVGESKANPFGLCDMHGNVAEWVHDGWEPDFYDRFVDKAAIDPRAPASAGGLRVVRGGCFAFAEILCRSSFRDARDPVYYKTHGIGYRVALSVDAVRDSISARRQSTAEPPAPQ